MDKETVLKTVSAPKVHCGFDSYCFRYYNGLIVKQAITLVLHARVKGSSPFRVHLKYG